MHQLPNNQSAITSEHHDDVALEASVNDSIVTDRIDRFQPFMLIWITIGIVFAAFYLLKLGSAPIFACCIVSATFNVVLIALERREFISRFVIANLLLANAVLWTVVVSLLTGGSASIVPMFFPIICLTAAQLLGMRAAISWFFLTILATYFCHYSPIAFSEAVLPTRFDRLFVTLAIGFTVLCLCDQAERFFVRRSVRLAALTHRLQEKSRLLGLAEETAGVGHWRWDLGLDQTSFSDELVRICCIEPLDEDGQPISKISTLVDRFEKAARVSFQSALDCSKNNGDPFTLELSFQENDVVRHVTCRGFSELDQQGKPIAIFGVMRDDTQLKEAAERLTKKADELKKLANFDPLTGLTNRFQFRRHLSRAVKYATDADCNTALLVLDMDGFKEINDTLGHATGDLVLQETAKRIKAVVSASDVVSRLGGDEFTVILRNIKTAQDVERIGQRIVDALRLPMEFDNTQLEVGASVGASICPCDADTPDELFTFADTAMYDAKFNGEDVCMYDPSMTADLIARKRVESKLIHALDRDEFRVVYQPQYNVASGKIIGFEALMRWERDGSFISPMEFIPLLESSGRIIEVGEWILDQACQRCQRWMQLGYRTRVAVNISPIQFRDPQFVSRVYKTISRYRIDPSLVDLEITEGLLISDVKQAAETLNELTSLGCMISVDDFGTGYSSLAYLKNFPINQLKIDRTFIKDIPEHDDGTIASSIIVLGLSLDLEVLAEGVETQEQLDFLKGQDCLSYQGRLSSMPVDEAACEKLLASHGTLLMPAKTALCHTQNASTVSAPSPATE